MTDQPHRHRTPDELWKAALAWIARTGWPTRDRDEAIADDIYKKWIKATDAEWAATHSRDYEVLTDLIAEAFKNLHDEEGVDSLQIFYMLDFTLRGRQEGKLKRRLVN